MKLSDATALYVGSDEVTKVYLGEDEVWSKSGPTPEGLEGEITVEDESLTYFGWSDGTAEDLMPYAFGDLSGPASSYFTGVFMWIPSFFQGLATLPGNLEGATLSFQGETYIAEYSPDEGLTGFTFGPEITTWPTSGTHKFWLLLPE